MVSEHRKIQRVGPSKPNGVRRWLPLLIAAVAVTVLQASVPPAEAWSPTFGSKDANAARYSPPTYFPLRVKAEIGCTYKNCDGGTYHPYWALDLGAEVGSPVYAAGAGIVSRAVTGNAGCSANSNNVLVQNGDNVYTYYTHLGTVAVKVGDQVDENTQLGTVGTTGLLGEGCWPHLHYEKRTAFSGHQVDPGDLNACEAGKSVSYPADVGPGYSNWADVPAHKYGVSPGEPTCAPASRIGVLDTSGNLFVKEGDLGAPWVKEYGGVKQVALAGNRIGILDTSGNAFVKEGDLGAPWVKEYSQVVALRLAAE